MFGKLIKSHPRTELLPRDEQPPAQNWLNLFPWLQLEVTRVEITVHGEQAHVRAESSHLGKH